MEKAQEHDPSKGRQRDHAQLRTKAGPVFIPDQVCPSFADRYLCGTYSWDSGHCYYEMELPDSVRENTGTPVNFASQIDHE